MTSLVESANRLKNLKNKATASEFRSLIVVFVIMTAFRNKTIEIKL